MGASRRTRPNRRPVVGAHRGRELLWQKEERPDAAPGFAQDATGVEEVSEIGGAAISLTVSEMLAAPFMWE
jgi:hypothetical protein